MKKRIGIVGLVIILMIGVTTFMTQPLSSQDMPFGNDSDVAFAEKVWKAMDGYQDWKMSSDYYAGTSPHGKFLRLYYNLINVDDMCYHVIVKDNYGGEGASIETVAESPDEYLAAVTIMVQRDKEYDPDNKGWFWVKYGADGGIMKNPKGVALAGRVAKGTGSGCIACHKDARDNDYVFTNDR